MLAYGIVSFVFGVGVGIALAVFVLAQLVLKDHP